MDDKKPAAILVVDDDPVILDALSMGLGSKGYRVDTAASGEAALAHCLRTPPDLAILDIEMPGLSGIETARRLRETTAVPVMFLTAHDQQGLVEQAVAEGGLGYLVKPVGINQLVPAIEAALARAHDIGNLERTSRHLGHALEVDRNISIAIGILMERHGLADDLAFDALRQQARSQGRKVSVLAREIVAAVALLNGLAGQGSSGERKRGEGR